MFADEDVATPSKFNFTSLKKLNVLKIELCAESRAQKTYGNVSFLNEMDLARLGAVARDV